MESGSSLVSKMHDLLPMVSVDVIPSGIDWCGKPSTSDPVDLVGELPYAATYSLCVGRTYRWLLECSVLS